MAVSLYRRYRPQKFSQVVGQGAAIDVLVHALSNDRVGHAYLFSGPRGCGKTSVARILAKALNCQNPDGTEPCGECPSCVAITAGESLDVVEIDGASNNSVDEVRELKTHVTLAPFAAKFKVYIIDEVHMLSTAAFNALLKTLEEPPSYVVFILATTEPHKVPVTIRSRCQHIPFHSIGAKQIFEQLQRVCEWENVAAQPEALWEVARQADGAMRDALSMLEQVINRSSGEVGIADVEATLGAGSRPALERWIATLRDDDGSAYTGLKGMLAEGTSPQRLFEELFSLTRNLWLAARWPGILEGGALDVSEQEREFLKAEAPKWDAESLRKMLGSLVDLITQARLGVRADVLLGLFMLALSHLGEPEADTQPGTRAPVERIAPPKPRVAAPAPSVPSAPTSAPAPAPAPELPPKPQPAPRASVPLPALDWQPLSQETEAALLSAAHEANFTLYCALLDADFKEAGDCLLLDLRDRYPYEVLRLERNSAALGGLFPRYGEGVFLKCGEETFVCPKSAGGTRQAKTLPAESTPAPAPALAPTSEAAPEPAPEFEPALYPDPEPEPEPELESESEPAPSALPFNGLLQEVARLMGGEVVLVRRGSGEANDGDEGDAENEHDEGE